MAVPGSIYSGSESSENETGRPTYHHQQVESGDGTFSESFDTFLDLIAAERLSKMPHSGSQWDRVLKHAEILANQVMTVHRVLEEDSRFRSETAPASFWTNCRWLLELGQGQASSLEQAFQILHDLSTDTSVFGSHDTEFSFDVGVAQYLGKTCASLHNLAANVVAYLQQVQGSSSSIVDFNAYFGTGIRDFGSCRQHLLEAVWHQQIQTASATEGVVSGYLEIHQWLAPRDEFLKSMFLGPSPFQRQLPEFSCKWFEKHLLAFFKGGQKTLMVTGKPGCGKTFLHRWIVDRLQRPLLGQQYAGVSYLIDSAVTVETSPVRLIQNLLLQLLDQNVGDMELFRSLSTAYQTIPSSSNQMEQQSALWQVFEAALSTVACSKKTVLLVDGLDAVMIKEATLTRDFAQGGEPAALQLCDDIVDLVTRTPNARAIILSRPFSKRSQAMEHFTITTDHTLDDMVRMTNLVLAANPPLRDEPEERRQNLSKRIAQGAGGSFLWADFALEMLLKEKTLDAFLRALEKMPKSLAHLLQRLVSGLDWNGGAIKSVVSWLVVAQRPLSLTEIQLLAGPDARRESLTASTSSGSYDIVRFNGSLFSIENGVVRFRHNVLHQFLLDMSSQSRIIMPLKDAHRDLCIRLLKTVRPDYPLFNTPTTDLSMSPSQLFEADSLFEYTARYWLVHFEQSSMQKSNGEITLTNDFKKSLPSTATLSVVEGIVWAANPVGLHPVEMHKMALKIRREANENSLSVLQSLINTGLLLQQCEDKASAAKNFFEASLLSRNLGISDALTGACASQFLVVTDGITDSGRQEPTTRELHKGQTNLEIVLRILIQTSINQYGAGSEQAIKYQKTLSDLYAATGQEVLSVTILDELHDVMVSRWGQNSAEAHTINEELVATLQRVSMKGNDTMHFASKLFSLAQQTMDGTDSRRIAATFRMAEAYEVQNDFSKAEELLVNVWTRMAEVYRQSTTEELQDAKMGAAIAYAEFLLRRSRESEAIGVLLGLCSECESMDTSSDLMAGRLKQLEKMLRSTGQPAAALSLLALCWRSYVRQGNQYSEQADLVASAIARTVQELPSAFSDYESVLRQVVDARLHAASKNQLDEATMRLCDSISDQRVRRQDWTEAISILRGILQSLWPSLTGAGTDRTMPQQFQQEAWTLAERLAYCFTCRNRLEEAFQIYFSMYEASKASSDPELIGSATQSLIQFCNATNQIDRAIKIHDELLQFNRKKYGARHPVTVESLQTLAYLCDTVGSPLASSYYQEVLSVTDRESLTTTPNHVKAALRLSEIYAQDGKWPETVDTCQRLFNMIDRTGSQGVVTAQTLQLIQGRYTHALGQDAKVNNDRLQQVAEQYFHISSSLFPREYAIISQAALQLGQADEGSDLHRVDASAIYEKVIDIVGQAPTPKDPELAKASVKAKERLTALYRAVALNPTNHPAPAVQKTVAMFLETYNDGKVHQGRSVPTTLVRLEEIVALYHRTGTEQDPINGLRILQDATVDILSNETSPLRLFESAQKLAAIYHSHGYEEQGYQLADAVRRQIIFRYTVPEDGFDLSLRTPLDRRYFVFIATFTEGLKMSGAATFSDLMSNVLTESVLMERLDRAEAFDQKLVCGAHLRQFLRSNKRYIQASIVETMIFEAFMTTLITSSIASEQNMRALLIKIIEQVEKDENSIGKCACIAGDILTLSHIQQGEFVDAYEVAFCAYNFAKSLGAYQDRENVVSGFNLALYMAGRGRGGVPTSEALRGQMRGLSKLVLHEMLTTCKDINIDIIQMRLPKLKDLAELLSEHQNYADLEWLLAILWSSHVAQKSWSAKDILWFGKRFVEVRLQRGQQDLAIQLCEDIIYNLTTLWGSLNPVTLEMSNVLSDLYSTCERHEEAAAVHEEILRQSLDSGVKPNRAEAAHIAKKHLRYLKQSSQRAGNGASDFFEQKSELLEQLAGEFGEDSVDEDAQLGGSQSIQKSNAKAVPAATADVDDEDAEILFTPRKGLRRRV